MTELQKAFDEGFEAVKGYVDRSFATVYKRIKALEDAEKDALTKRVSDMEAQIKALATPKPRVSAGIDK